ncbi:diacylglycerol kinase [soil metagenome]|nr:diacylglycerol kinase family lipid kinase [Rubrobacteraceae bacterium]MDQ3436788.1 diacylglycerol kinase family lipid kinase [Actinomycetota bacterium]
MTIEESGLKARVICNPASGGGGYDPEKIRAELEGFEVEWIETKESGDASEAAKEWDNGLLIVAGGDGTINEVVNGLGRAGFPGGVVLGILPAGTGNDLAATLAIPADPDEAEEVLRQNRVRLLDVARVRSTGIGEKFFINVATGGLGAEISDAADSEAKKRWGKLAYLRFSLEAARNYAPKEVVLTLDGEEHRVRAVNLAVGNCRYAGGGWLASPRANPEDGLLDLVVVEAVGLTEVLDIAPAVLGDSDYLEKEGVFFARASEIRVESEPGSLEFTVDGEVIGDEPTEFTVIPKALKVIVGPEYAPEPEE